MLTPEASGTTGAALDRPGAGPAAILWRLREGVTVAARGWDSLEVSFRGRHATLRELSPEMRSVLDQLVTGGVPESALADPLVAEGETALAEWYCHLDLLQRLTAIEWIVTDQHGVLGALVGMSGAFRPAFEALDPAVSYVLSSFAFLRATDGAWVVESPLANARVRLAGRALSLLAEFATPKMPADLGSGRDMPASAALIAILMQSAGLLQSTDDSGRGHGDAAALESGWDFADALFHFRSRSGRSDAHFGARAGPGKLPAPKAAIDPASRIGLPRTTARAPASASLREVLARRQSIRSYGSRPIALEQLAEFLLLAAGEGSSAPGRRSYPSGGACYPLELYVVANRCEGLSRDVFRYDPAGHALDRISSPPGAVDTLVALYQATAATDPIQVLFLVTLRFRQISDRYDSIAYALALKEVGALFQTMYLVAASLGLAPCAIGMGNSITVADAFGIDPLEEASVGEFLLGSRPIRD